MSAGPPPFCGRSDRPAEARLLEAAHRLFCREGIAATGVARVIEEAGVARKTLYERFGSKENLVAAVLAQEGAAWRDWFSAALERFGPDPLARLRGVFEVLHDWFADDGFFGCAFTNALAEGKSGDQRIVSLFDEHRAKTNAILRAMINDAGFEQTDSLTEQLALIIEGAIMTAMTTGDPKAAHRAGEIAEILFAASPRRALKVA